MKLPASAIRIALLLAFAPLSAFADVAISINIAPPELPIYAQPELPGDGYIWTPGYWAWDGDDYYCVPGTWVLPPRAGLLWTPAWWAWDGEFYQFRTGYWGTSVGYYGGIDYGYGYGGRGYQGGRWDHGRFHYNRAVNHIDRSRIHDSYRQDVVRHGPEDHRSYNGGDGGTRSRPGDRERNRDHQQRFAETADQVHHEQAARQRPDLRRNANHGLPSVAATPQPAALDDRRVMPAHDRWSRAGTNESGDHRPPVTPFGQRTEAQPPPDSRMRQRDWQHEPRQPSAPPKYPTDRRDGGTPQQRPQREQQPMQQQREARPAQAPQEVPRGQQPPRPEHPQNGSRPGENGPRDHEQHDHN
jgi:hypothetical protein